MTFDFMKLNPTLIRGLLYCGIALLTTIQGGLKPNMTWQEGIGLFIAAVLSVLVALRAYIDTTPAESADAAQKIVQTPLR